MIDLEKLQKMDSHEILEYIKESIVGDGSMQETEDLNNLGRSTLSNTITGHMINSKVVIWISEYTQIPWEIVLSTIIDVFKSRAETRIRKEIEGK